MLVVGIALAIGGWQTAFTKLFGIYSTGYLAVPIYQRRTFVLETLPGASIAESDSCAHRGARPARETERAVAAEAEAAQAEVPPL